MMHSTLPEKQAQIHGSEKDIFLKDVALLPSSVIFAQRVKFSLTVHHVWEPDTDSSALPDLLTIVIRMTSKENSAIKRQ